MQFSMVIFRGMDRVIGVPEVDFHIDLHFSSFCPVICRWIGQMIAAFDKLSVWCSGPGFGFGNWIPRGRNIVTLPFLRSGNWYCL